MKTYSPVGARTASIEGVPKVTGQCKYTFDLHFPGMLVAKALYPDYPRARIKRLDTTAARSIPGVAAVVTHHDIPGEKRFGPILKDQPIFAIEEVCYAGDMVAAVAAMDEATAERALAAIEVEYEPLPGVFDPLAAFQSNELLARLDLSDNILGHHSIIHGDADQGFAEADVIIEGTYRTQAIEHLYMEIECAVALWDGETLVVYSSGQDPHGERAHLADVLALPANRVRVICPPLGGGFGGKEEPHIQAHTALLAMKAGRPVKFVRSREESFRTHVKRTAVRIRHKLGAKADGTMVAVEAEIIGDAGPYGNLFLAVMGVAAEFAAGPYDIPNARINSYAVATNNINGGGFRGFGGPEIVFAAEQNVELLAQKLGMESLALRLQNGLKEGSFMPSGVCLHCQTSLTETIQQAAEASRWHERDAWLEREPAPGMRRGLGAAAIAFPSGIGRNLMDHTTASVEMAPDGSVLLLSGIVEMGQGSLTVQAQIVAQELGVRVENVNVVLPDTHTVPDAGVTSASRSVYMMGNAILEAARPVRRSLLETAASALEAAPDDLEIGDNRVWVRGSAERYIAMRDLARRAWLGNKQLRGVGFTRMWQPTQTKRAYSYPIAHSIFTFATQIVQVLVDTETGHVKVEKVWAAHDVGKAINPLGIEGQIDGGVVQGMGFALMEELQQEDGRLVNATLEGYAVPMAVDVPEIVPLIVEVPEPTGPHGAKGVGEPPCTPIAAAIANAIADATGVRITQLPMSPERVLRELRQQAVQP
jgi:CO/xanthine dehydrogenase Mo-binding subunit